MKRSTWLFLLPFLFYSPAIFSALLNLSNTPLFMNNSVPPNVVFEVDDQGSMDWEIMANPYWEGCAYDSNITGSYDPTFICGSNIYNSGLFRGYDGNNFHYYAYMFHNTDNSYNDNCGKNNDQSS